MTSEQQVLWAWFCPANGEFPLLLKAVIVCACTRGDRMQSFLAELKRRHIYRVAAAYAVVAWVLLQLVNNLTPALKLPDWIATAIVVLLAIGFPLALLFCWIQHLTPANGPSQQAKTSKLDWILASSLAAVIVLIVYEQLAATPAARLQANIAAPTAKSASISIAVLP